MWSIGMRLYICKHSLLSTSRTLVRHEQRSNWHLVTLMSLGIITILTFLGYFLKTCQGKLSSYNLTRRDTSQQGTHEPGTTANVPDPEHSEKRFQQRPRRKECGIQCLLSPDT